MQISDDGDQIMATLIIQCFGPYLNTTFLRHSFRPVGGSMKLWHLPSKQLMGVVGIGGIIVGVTGNPAFNSRGWSASAASLWE